MAKATNQLEVTRQIGEWKAASVKVIEAINRLRQVVNQDKAVGQTWNELPTDYPALVDGDGAIVGETFTPGEIQTTENKSKELIDIFENNATGTPAGDWEKIFRQLSGITA